MKKTYISIAIRASLVLLTFVLLFSFIATANAADYEVELPEVIEYKSLQPIRKVLDAAQEGDRIYITIQSYGGLVYEMNNTLTAMSTTKATIICHIPKFAYSAAALIFIACDEHYMAPKAEILFHYANFGTTAMVPKTIRTALNYFLGMKKIFKSYNLHKMMTEAEWDELNEGADVIYRGEVFLKRLLLR